jgi:hypothetical protein
VERIDTPHGVREKYGGSVLAKGLKKGDMVSGMYKGKKVTGLARSYSKGYVGIATFKKSQRWIVPEHTNKRRKSWTPKPEKLGNTIHKS